MLAQRTRARVLHISRRVRRRVIVTRRAMAPSFALCEFYVTAVADCVRLTNSDAVRARKTRQLYCVYDKRADVGFGLCVSLIAQRVSACL